MNGIDVPGLVALVVMLAIVLAPLLWAAGRGALDDPGPESDGGGGDGPWPPRAPTEPPPSGIPLEDADPARVRLRDHGRLSDRLPRRARRPTPEPARSPRRVKQSGG